MCVCVCVCGACVGRVCYLHNNQVCTFMHMYVLCENSDSVRNKNPKSLQVVLCVCAHVFIHAHVTFNSASGASPVSLCVRVCVCTHVCTFMHIYAL